MSDVYESIRHMTQMRHRKNFEDNMKLLEESGLPFEKRDSAMLFRKGCVKADFYPHTGRWKYGAIILGGGAKKFLEWYKRAV